jgi:hypothetical protein
MKKNHANRNHVWIPVLSMLMTVLMTIFFSCQKSTQTLDTDSSTVLGADQETTKYLPRGLNELLNLPELSSDIKKNLDTKYYRYLSNASGKLWVFTLKKGALGFKSAKVAVAVKNRVGGLTACKR